MRGLKLIEEEEDPKGRERGKRREKTEGARNPDLFTKKEEIGKQEMSTQKEKEENQEMFLYQDSNTEMFDEEWKVQKSNEVRML